jgi:hypothetical protein
MKTPARNRTSASRALPGAAAILLLVSAIASAQSTAQGLNLVTTASVSGLDEMRPLVQGRSDDRLRNKLDLAFRIAAQRLHDRRSCRALFSELGTDGLGRLRNTRYQSAEEVGGERVCHRGAGVAAYTAVGNSRTVVCPGFGSLNPKQAAVIVLHEALHFAGLPESPSTPGAMNPAEINEMVADRCGL